LTPSFAMGAGTSPKNSSRSSKTFSISISLKFQSSRVQLVTVPDFTFADLKRRGGGKACEIPLSPHIFLNHFPGRRRAQAYLRPVALSAKCRDPLDLFGADAGLLLPFHLDVEPVEATPWDREAQVRHSRLDPFGLEFPGRDDIPVPAVWHSKQHPKFRPAGKVHLHQAHQGDLFFVFGHTFPASVITVIASMICFLSKCGN